MQHTALNMAIAFLISIVVGYWVSHWLILDHEDRLRIVLLPKSHPSPPHISFKTVTQAEENFISPIFKSLSPCDPFLDKNMCQLSPSLQTLLKTTTQQNQYIYILRKLDELELPAQLALIPFIETHYHRYVRSPRGAAGLWQLMPETAKDYGLSDYQRFELEASTHAALLFLRQLHQQFGSWELAVAAYNAGSKRVQAAITAKPSAKHIKELNLPNETKKYVSSYLEMKLQ